jgi:hypothetical protein
MRVRSAKGSAKLAILLVTTLAVVACSGTDGRNPSADHASSHTFVVVEDDGVPTAVTSGGPRFTGELFTYEKVLELRDDPDRPESMLVRPNSFTMDADGFFYVLDAGNHRIAVFDPEGSYVRSMGRQGEGPGEFPLMPSSSPIQLRHGLLAVPIIQTGRTYRFRPDGTFVDVISDGLGTGPGRRTYAASDGTLVVWSDLRNRDADFQRLGMRLSVLGADGNPTATVDTQLVVTDRIVTVEIGGQSRPTSMPIVFSGMPQALLLASDEILTSTGEEPILRWYDLAGNLTRQARLDLPPEPVTDEDRALVRAGFERMVAQTRETGNERRIESAQRRLENLEFREAKTFWGTVVPTDSGHLWLMKHPRELPDPTGNMVIEYRVLDPEGRYLGDTIMPPMALPSVRIVGGNVLAMVVDPDTGEPLPTVFRMRVAVDGLSYP